MLKRDSFFYALIGTLVAHMILALCRSGTQSEPFTSSNRISGIMNDDFLLVNPQGNIILQRVQGISDAIDYYTNVAKNAAINEANNHTNTKHKAAKEYTDERHDAAISHADTKQAAGEYLIRNRYYNIISGVDDRNPKNLPSLVRFMNQRWNGQYQLSLSGYSSSVNDRRREDAKFKMI